MSEKQLALIGKFRLMEDVTAYEESKEKVRIFFEDSSIPGEKLEIVKEFGYEVEKINGYADHTYKGNHATSEVCGMEILAKPAE